MGEVTKIQWTDHTFNPWRGCTKVSPGCAHCYAERQSRRNPAVLGIWGDAGSRVVAAESAWREPLKWDRAAREAGERRRVFCASLADVFEDRGDRHVHDSQGNVLWVNRAGRIISAGQTTPGLVRGERPATLEDVRGQLRSLIGATPGLDWLLLTKRPENAARSWAARPWPDNVWLGTSVEDQTRADERIPSLLEIPARVRFLSCEPLLGPVDIGAGLGPGFQPNGRPLIAVDWVIIGGESGPGARPCHVEWVRSLVNQCRDAGVAPFVKQYGANPWVGGEELCLMDGKGGDPIEWHADLRVREFPTPVAV